MGTVDGEGNVIVRLQRVRDFCHLRFHLRGNLIEGRKAALSALKFGNEGGEVAQKRGNRLFRVFVGDIFLVVDIRARDFIDGRNAVLDFDFGEKRVADRGNASYRRYDAEQEAEKNGEKLAPKAALFPFFFVVICSHFFYLTF